MLCRGRNRRHLFAHVDLPHRHSGSFFAAVRQLCISHARARLRHESVVQKVRQFMDDLPETNHRVRPLLAA